MKCPTQRLNFIECTKFQPEITRLERSASSDSKKASPDPLSPVFRYICCLILHNQAVFSWKGALPILLLFLFWLMSPTLKEASELPLALIPKFSLHGRPINNKGKNESNWDGWKRWRADWSISSSSLWVSWVSEWVSEWMMKLWITHSLTYLIYRSQGGGLELWSFGLALCPTCAGESVCAVPFTQ